MGHCSEMPGLMEIVTKNKRCDGAFMDRNL